MKADLQLKLDVEAELASGPRVSGARVAVSADDGAVTLLGGVGTFGEKLAAVSIAKRVSGVRALADELTVKMNGENKRTDEEIAAATLAVLNSKIYLPRNITATTRNGAVTLEGHASWQYQREAAVRAVCNLMGVFEVLHLISLTPQTSGLIIKENIERALERQAKTDSSSIQVETAGGQVTLRGSAESWRSIEDALTAAWAAPGVTHVIDHLKMSALP